MRIYDCFIFNDETKVLKTRIQYLNSIVSFFVIAESNQTFSGIEKSYFADEVIRESLLDPSRFIRVKYEFPKELVRKASQTGNRWILEQYARSSLEQIISKLNADDLVILSDVDEIPSHEQIIKSANLNSLTRVLTPVFHGKLNWKIRGGDPWLTVKIGPARTFQNVNLNQIRYAVVPIAKAHIQGSHFSDMYKSLDEIKRKAESSAHSEFDIDSIKFKLFTDYADRFKLEYRGRFFRKGMGLVSVTKQLSDLQKLLYELEPMFLDESPTPKFYKRVCASYNLTVAWGGSLELKETNNYLWFVWAIVHHFAWRMRRELLRVKRRIIKLFKRLTAS
jgi:hypothetical protein